MIRYHLMLALWFFACIGVALSSPVVDSPDVPLRGDESLPIINSGIGFNGGAALTGTLIGDTLIVGTTGWDMQHNGNVGRQISHFLDDDGWHISVAWMKLEGVHADNPRHVVQTMIHGSDQGYTYDPDPPDIVHNGYRSGFATVAVNPNDGSPFLAFHHKMLQSDRFDSYAYHPSAFIPGVWIPHLTPRIFTEEHVWPKTTMGADGFLHVANHHTNASLISPSHLSYMRWYMDEALGLIPAMPHGNPDIVSFALANVSADIVTNRDGSKVALAACVDRNYTLDEKFMSGQGRWNNDIYVWESNNSGGGFSDSPMDITSFFGPVFDAPDTNFANQDVRRAYTDCSLFYDDENQLHAAFTAHDFDFIRAKVYYESSVFHWMKHNGEDIWTLIHHQPYNGLPESWGRTVDRPSLYFDDNTGILWCVMEVVDAGPEGTDMSVSSGCANTNIFISASPPGEYNGLLWTKAVNITNSKYTQPGGALPGDSRSETDVSIALNNDGDYLHLLYMLDLDGGCAVQFEGTMTDNPMVYHRVLKSTLLQEFANTGEWVASDSLHFNGWGCWEDPGEWLWDEYGGFYTTSRDSASALSLEMEPTANSVDENGGLISAMVTVNNQTLIDYPGLDVWTMITFPSGEQYGPLLTLTVDLWRRTTIPNVPVNQIVPHDAPSGTYQYSMYAGYYPNDIISDSFTFPKYPGGEEIDTFNPEDWPTWMWPIVQDPQDEPEEFLFPDTYKLSQAHPNPFNPTTTLVLSLPSTVDVSVVVYDITGRQVVVLAEGHMQTGHHDLVFDGSSYSSGVYFVHAVVDGELTEYRKLVLIK